MLLRKLAAAFCPLLLCLITCMIYHWLDTLMSAGSFWSFLLKGMALGLCAALVLPAAGVKHYTNGLTPWLLVGAAVLLLLLLYQYLESIGAVHSELLLTVLTINGQVVLVESTVMGFMLTTALLNRRR
ncbi:MAG: hypothetical protein PHI98_01880 [Eubacteriales bacterium]|nr:hypothetical protein [Eubacteriales bacterium]